MSVEPHDVATTEVVFFATVAAVAVISAGLLAGLETGMYRLSRVRLSIRAARGDRGAQRLAREYARPRRMLATLLVANAIAGWFASFGTSQVLDALGYGVVTAVILDLVILLPVALCCCEPRFVGRELFRWLWGSARSRRGSSVGALVNRNWVLVHELPRSSRKARAARG